MEMQFEDQGQYLMHERRSSTWAQEALESVPAYS